MKKILFLISLFLCFTWLGCTVDKNIQDKLTKFDERLSKLEQKVEAIQKMLNPHKEDDAQKEAYDIPVGSSHVYPGPHDKNKAQIVIFDNFQCPYCAQADMKLKELFKDPKIKDKIEIVFKHFPFERHPIARAASKAAIAAGEQGNDKFWKMVEVLFKHQGDLTEANFPKYAQEAGLNVNKFKEDLKNNDKKYDEIINEDIKIGSEKAHLRGTPWILINGWLLEGDISPASIENMLNKQKEQAKPQ